MNKEDIILLDNYLKDLDLSKEMQKLREKVNLIVEQIKCQEKIQEIQKKLGE